MERREAGRWMDEGQTETKGRLATVAETTPKQARETKDRWSWVERSVWTEAMLTALEKGLKGGKWYSLMDKVYNRRNLTAAWEQVRSNRGSSGVDRQSVELFGRNAATHLETIAEDL